MTRAHCESTRPSARLASLAPRYSFKAVVIPAAGHVITISWLFCPSRFVYCFSYLNMPEGPAD